MPPSNWVRGHTKRGAVRTIVVTPAYPGSQVQVLIQIWSKTGDAPLAQIIVDKAELLDAIIRAEPEGLFEEEE